MWPAKSLRTLFRNKCTPNWIAGCTFALALCKARQQRTIFQWQTGRKELRFCSIGTNSYLLFVFAGHTGWRILSVNATQRRIGRSRCFWQKLTIIHCIRFLSAPSHSDDINPLNAELNPICYLLALLGAHHFLHVNRIRVKSLTRRLLKSYIYGAPILEVSRSHTTTHHSR